MSSPNSDVRAARRAQREAERAARAQRKADAARERALEAARAGGLFEGMSAMPRTETSEAVDTAAAAGTAEDTGGTGTATARTATGTAAAQPATGTAPAPAAARAPLDPARRRTLITALSVVSVLLVVVAGLASWQYVEAREATATEQRIADAPRAATDAAREITTQMFTYDHRTVDADLGAVRERLADPALSEFVEQSMPTVASAAKQQEATVYATVAAAAPQEVTDAERVTVLVMLNRMVSTKDAPEAASSASRLSVDMVRQDGTWKLAELNAL